MGNSSSSSPSASASPPSTGNQAAKPMAKTKKTSIQQKQKPNNTYKNNQNNNNNNNNNKTSTLSSSPPLSLFQKAAVTRHAITDDNDMDGDNGNGNGNTTSTATPLSHKGIWDYYDKLEQIAQGSTCDIFTVTRKTTTTATETATTSSSSSSKSKPTYVVKQMIKDRVSKAILEEMQAEIDILSTLDHPHVVLIYETFQDKHNFYIVMEHLKGGDLYSRRSHYYTEPQVAKIMTQICSAMVYCHENNVVHRDIKMENIIFDTKDPDSDITLIDFGLSTKYIKSPGHDKLTDKVGTMYSISPQVLQGAYNEKADMWAAGVVAFILLSGKRPFDADNDRELAKIIYKGQYSMAGPEWQAVSTPAKKFVQGLLQYEPSLRLSAAAALRTPFLQKNYSLAERQPDASTLHRIQQALIDSQKASQLQKFAMMVVAHQMPVEEIAELRAAFDAMDQNNHGTINYWEFQRALSQFQKLPHKELKRLFQELDQNHTGVINYSEFLAATLDTRRLVEQDILRSAFDKLDLDESGFVEPDELEQMLGDTTMDHHMLQEMFNQMDRDGDGRISYNEFRQAFDALQAEKLKQAQLS